MFLSKVRVLAPRSRGSSGFIEFLAFVSVCIMVPRAFYSLKNGPTREIRIIRGFSPLNVICLTS